MKQKKGQSRNEQLSVFSTKRTPVSFGPEPDDDQQTGDYSGGCGEGEEDEPERCPNTREMFGEG